MRPVVTEIRGEEKPEGKAGPGLTSWLHLRTHSFLLSQGEAEVEVTSCILMMDGLRRTLHSLCRNGSWESKESLLVKANLKIL